MDIHETPLELRLDRLVAIRLLGKGATGTVFLVREDSVQAPFALKVVDKTSVRQLNRRARREIYVLSRLSSEVSCHPFLPHLIGVFENREIICWATPYCPGGDLNVLRYHQSDHVFSPAVIRFYLAEIVCAIEHLHEQGIVFRDLKPENVLVQQSGHVTLTDFDLSCDLDRCKLGDWRFSSDFEDGKLAKHLSHYRTFPRFLFPGKGNKGLKKAKSSRISPMSRRNPADFRRNERSNSFVGTAEYVAPEVIRGDGHEFSVDWWALGVICYEMLYGTTPFKGKNREETFGNILFANPKCMGRPCPLTDLIMKLLEKDPTRRLGYWRGAREIKNHEFFHGLRWDLLTEVFRPPHVPSKDDADIAEGGIGVGDYYRKLVRTLPPLSSPSMDERPHNVSLAEF